MPTNTTLPSHDRFAATRWSLVATASSADDASARRALIELCLRYWYPVYAYVRGCGHDAALAGEIVRAFFEQLVSTRMAGGNRGYGRFRQHLLQMLHQFLASDWRSSADGEPVAEFERMGGEFEGRYQTEVLGGLGPEQAYQRSYALQILNTALDRLRIEAQQAGRLDMFDALMPFLSEEPIPGQLAHLAQRLDLAPLALVISLKRLRQRFRELVQLELAQTVTNAADLEQERAVLAQVLALK